MSVYNMLDLHQQPLTFNKWQFRYVVQTTRTYAKDCQQKSYNAAVTKLGIIKAKVLEKITANITIDFT